LGLWDTVKRSSADFIPSARNLTVHDVEIRNLKELLLGEEMKWISKPLACRMESACPNGVNYRYPPFMAFLISSIVSFLPSSWYIPQRIRYEEKFNLARAPIGCLFSHTPFQNIMNHPSFRMSRTRYPGVTERYIFALVYHGTSYSCILPAGIGVPRVSNDIIIIICASSSQHSS
jgi:hypothetical protein